MAYDRITVPPPDDDEDWFVPVPECAERMGITVEQLWGLIESHALRAHRWGGWGDVMVQPAIVSGAGLGAERGPHASAQKEAPKRKGRRRSQAF